MFREQGSRRTEDGELDDDFAEDASAEAGAPFPAAPGRDRSDFFGGTTA